MENQAHVGVVSGPRQTSETYIDINIRGNIIPALLDTGCDHSVVPRRCVPNVALQSTTMELWAGNGTKISVLGSMKLKFTVKNLSLVADVLVSDSIDEIMLGYDWLSSNGCQRHFDKSVIIIKGMSVSLRSRPTRASVRRVLVRDQIVIDAGHSS